ncbi:hypothetical protein Ccrd_016675 [Cynara cardunculus var. scolymus]|uniref:Uncharacterized protein n=1 Tax=Cynara cardunculus var. scolymus TaxID=59895 RepID=A0A103Y9H5_CYNCS|nr:hypothetical protein Ccrd_016675 [Cynara cardunculus var. scolymus]
MCMIFVLDAEELDDQMMSVLPQLTRDRISLLSNLKMPEVSKSGVSCYGVC